MIHPPKLILFICLSIGFGSSTPAAGIGSSGSNPALSWQTAYSGYCCQPQNYPVQGDNPMEWVDRFGLTLEDFFLHMGPTIEQFLNQVEDWSVYQLPEFLPNGDIIIRRRTPKPRDDTDRGIDDSSVAVDL